MERLSVGSWWRAAFSGVSVAVLAACNYSSSSGGGSAGLSVDESAPRLNAAALVDVDAGGPGEGDIVVLTFDRSVVISGGESEGQVLAIHADAPSDTFGVGAQQGQSVPGSRQVEIVLGEDPELFAGALDAPGITRINIVNGSGRVVPIEATNGVRAAPSTSSIGLENVTGDAPMAIAASYFDADNDLGIGVGDIVLVTFDQPVVVPDGDPVAGAFSLPVAGDSFGAGAIIEPASNMPTNRGVRILLGTDPVLTLDGSFSSAAIVAGDPSGLAVVAGAVVTDAVESSGAPVAAGVLLDVVPGDANLFGSGRSATAVVGG